MEIENHYTNSKPQLPLADRWKIVHYKELGSSGEGISKILPASKPTCNAIYKKYQETGDVSNSPKTGRPIEVTPEESKMVIETIRAHPELSLSQLKR